MTSTNVRFFVNTDEMIVDRLNDANTGIASPCSYGYELIEDEADLREQVLHHHLRRSLTDRFTSRRSRDYAERSGRHLESRSAFGSW